MLDVDGQVISADVLVERIEHLLEAVHSAGQVPGAAPAGPLEPVAHLDAPVHAMRSIHRQMHPPVIDGNGVRGRAGSVVKRAVRKATSWYVEPRWIQQQQLDGYAVEFSSQAFNSIFRIDLELDELRRQVTRLKMQLVASMERTNRVRRDVAGVVDDLAAQGEMLHDAALQSDVRPLAKEITSILDRLGAIGTTGADIDYVGFEDRFRGGTDELRAAQDALPRTLPPGPGRGTDHRHRVRAGRDAVHPPRGRP